MFTFRNSKIANKIGTAVMIFPFILITGEKKTDEENYMYKIYKKQYTDLFSIGCFLAIALLFFIFGMDFVSPILFMLLLIPIFFYDLWLFVELIFKKFNLSEVSFVRQAKEFGPDWIKPCEERKEYISLSWLKYIIKKEK